MKYNLLEKNYFMRSISELAHDAIWNGRGSSDEDKDGLRLLAQNIITDGQEKALVVMPIPSDIHLITDEYERETWSRIRSNYPKATDFVVSGNRRFLALALAEASKMVDSAQLACEYRDYTSLRDAREHNIAENAPEKTGQKQLTPFQISSQVLRLLNVEKFKVKEVAAFFGKTSAWVSQKKVLQNLCDAGWKALELKYINDEAAKAYAEMPDNEQRKALADKIFTTSQIKARNNEISMRKDATPSGPDVSDVVTDSNGETQSSSDRSPRSSSGSVGLKPSKWFCKWVDDLEATNAKSCPEVAILKAIRGGFHAQTQNDVLTDLAKIINRTGKYSNLGEGGKVNKTGKKADNVSTATA